jgi:hypothetical protein
MARSACSNSGYASGEGELHRVAMVLEAWAGNDVRIEREWELACAQAEDLEGGSPPARQPRASWPLCATSGEKGLERPSDLGA